MTDITSIKALIDLWPTRKVFAAEVDATLDRVHKWAQSGSIPARFHGRVIRAGQARGFAITADTLTKLHDRPDEEVAA